MSEADRTTVPQTAASAKDYGLTPAVALRTKPADTKVLLSVGSRLTLWRAPEEMARRVTQRWPEMRVADLPQSSKLVEELPDTDILVDYALKPANLALAKKLRWIHSPAAGVKQLIYPEMRSRGIFITNGRGVHAVPVAEHVIGMMVALARRFPDAFRYQQQNEWAQQKIWAAQPAIRELRGQIVLIIGFGAIGQEVGRAARALGMRVRAVTRSGKPEPRDGSELSAERIYPASGLDQAIPDSEFIVIAAPETDETHHMIGAAQLRAMKPTCFLINVARGTLVDEPALIEALENNTIAGAGLDVTEQEPLPAESRLWRLPNVMTTPHVSALSEQLWTRQTDLLIENLERWFSGKELLNPVNLEHGY